MHARLVLVARRSSLARDGCHCMCQVPGASGPIGACNPTVLSESVGMSNPPEPPRLMPLRPPPSLAIPPSNSVSYNFSSAYSPSTNKQQHSGHMANNTFFRPILPAPGLFDPCENRHLRGEANADTLTARDTQRSPPLLVFPTPVKPTPGSPLAYLEEHPTWGQLKVVPRLLSMGPHEKGKGASALRVCESAVAGLCGTSGGAVQETVSFVQLGSTPQCSYLLHATLSLLLRQDCTPLLHTKGSGSGGGEVGHAPVPAPPLPRHRQSAFASVGSTAMFANLLIRQRRARQARQHNPQPSSSPVIDKSEGLCAYVLQDTTSPSSSSSSSVEASSGSEKGSSLVLLDWSGEGMGGQWGLSLAYALSDVVVLVLDGPQHETARDEAIALDRAVAALTRHTRGARKPSLLLVRALWGRWGGGNPELDCEWATRDLLRQHSSRVGSLLNGYFQDVAVVALPQHTRGGPSERAFRQQVGKLVGEIKALLAGARDDETHLSLSTSQWGHSLQLAASHAALPWGGALHMGAAYVRETLARQAMGEGEKECLMAGCKLLMSLLYGPSPPSANGTRHGSTRSGGSCGSSTGCGDALILWFDKAMEASALALATHALSTLPVPEGVSTVEALWRATVKPLIVQALEQWEGLRPCGLCGQPRLTHHCSSHHLPPHRSKTPPPCPPLPSSACGPSSCGPSPASKNTVAIVENPVSRLMRAVRRLALFVPKPPLSSSATTKAPKDCVPCKPCPTPSPHTGVTGAGPLRCSPLPPARSRTPSPSPSAVPVCVPEPPPRRASRRSRSGAGLLHGSPITGGTGEGNGQWVASGGGGQWGALGEDDVTELLTTLKTLTKPLALVALAQAAEEPQRGEARARQGARLATRTRTLLKDRPALVTRLASSHGVSSLCASCLTAPGVDCGPCLHMACAQCSLTAAQFIDQKEEHDESAPRECPMCALGR